MSSTALGWYAGVLAAAAVLHVVGRRIRVPAAMLALAAALLVGHTGRDRPDPATLRELLPAVLVHLSFVLGGLGTALGRGLLRLPLLEIVRRSLRPLALAAFALLAGAALLPLLLPDLEPQRTYRRFLLPLAFVFAAFPLLAIRDLRGRPRRDAGATFLVATALVGGVYSFAPTLLWRSHLDAKVVLKEPILVLGESGAFGVAMAVVYLLLVRRLRLPRLLVGTATFVALMALSFRYLLWPPFAALGFGAALGRAGERFLPVPGAGRDGAYSELPFVILAGLAFAPDLYRQSLVVPSLLHAAYLGALLLIARWRSPEGSRLATGPGLLFLGLALAVRFDKRMGPLMRATVDFALPAWVILRGGWGVVAASRRLLARRAS